MTKIMPVFGSDIGFSQKHWRRIEASLSKGAQGAQYSDEEENDYFADLHALKVKSSSKGTIESEEQTELVYAPGSNWGGRERHVGFDYVVSVEVVLEGDVRYPYGGTDQEAAVAIAEHFDEGWRENPECAGVVDDASAEMLGSGEEFDHSAVVSSISRTGDKAYGVVVTFSVDISTLARRREDNQAQAQGSGACSKPTKRQSGRARARRRSRPPSPQPRSSTAIGSAGISAARTSLATALVR